MRNKDLPLVSIVIPVYNGANYLREAIDSALNQTYTNIEVVVVNDGSIDCGATREIALSYKDRIRYFEKENGGVSSALNYGIQVMKGDYFAWLSHDDKHLPQKVELQIEAIQNHKGNRPVICVCNYILIDGEGNEIARSPLEIEKYFCKSPKCFLGGETSFMIDGDATLISKRVFDLCGGFNESLFASQETDMWFRSLDCTDFIFLQDYLVEYRSHGQQVTHRRAAAVGKEAGDYRGNVFSQVTTTEIQHYYNSEKDMLRYGVTAYYYMCLQFYEAAHQMILKLREMSEINGDFVKSVLTGMFEHGDIQSIYDIMKNTISTESQKTRILIYCHEGIEELFIRRLTDFITNMKSDYEFYFVSCGEKKIELPQEVTSIIFDQQARGHFPNYIALLSELLSVDIYWGNSAYFLPNAMVLNYLSESRIRTISSFHYAEPTVNIFTNELDREDWKTPLSKASIITHEMNEFMFTQHIYPYDAVSLPPLSGDRDVCEKWDRFFQIIKSAEFTVEKAQDEFPAIGYKSDNPMLKVEVLRNLKQCLEKYEESVLEKHKLYYEYSLYWKITKPLRALLDLFR